VGGAETAADGELIRRIDRERFSPELCCLKHLTGWARNCREKCRPFTGLLSQKYDFARPLAADAVDATPASRAVVTVGAGDKMFWGRLAGLAFRACR